MYPAKFDIHKPATVREALGLLETFGDDAKLLAGGHSLLPMMKLRLAAPEHLIDLSGIPALREIRQDGDALVVGAMARHWEVHTSDLVRRMQPLLATVAGEIADPQVRNRGTIAGSLVHADPAADYPAAAMALNAEILCEGPEGQRVVQIGDWFLGMMTPALDPDEIVVQVRFPATDVAAYKGTYLKHHHPASRFAMVGVAVWAASDDQGRCQDIRIGITGVGMTAYRATAVEQALSGKVPDAALVQSAAALADTDAEDITSGFQLSPQEKAQLCRTLVARAVGKVLLAGR